MLFESDSENLIHLIKSPKESPWYILEMIAELKHRMRQIPYCVIQHNYKEGNKEAHGLANYPTDGSQAGNYSTSIWDRANPIFLNQILLNDSTRVTFPRVITI